MLNLKIQNKFRKLLIIPNSALRSIAKMPVSKSKALIDVRLDIQNSFSKVRTAVQELENGNGFSFDALNNLLKKCVSDTLNIAFTNKINELLNNNQIGSYIYYKDVLNSVEKFAGKNIQITAVTVDWLRL